MPPPNRFRVTRQPSLTISEAVAGQMASHLDAVGDLTPITLDSLNPTIRTQLEGRGYDMSEVVEEINAILRRRAARQKILDNWKAQGGPASPLGLPLDDSFPVQEAGGGYLVPFRGGNITIDGGLRVLNNDLGPACRVTFEGLILHSRQETSPDEIYGAGGFRCGSILLGDRVLTGNFVIPEVNLGGREARNTRVANMSQEIYRGAPAGLELFVAIREHDSGDRQEVRRKVRELMDEGAKNVAAALGAGFGNGDIAQAARAGEQISQGKFYEWLMGAAAEFITDFFGLSDDPYNPGGLTIPAEEMITPPPVMIAGHPWDNKTISYTHKIDMTGIDDSGAVGNCSAYFRVWR